MVQIEMGFVEIIDLDMIVEIVDTVFAEQDIDFAKSAATEIVVAAVADLLGIAVD